VDHSILAADPFVHSNIVGTHRLLEAARRHGCQRFHHVSTDEVFGSLEPGDPPFKETSPYRPNSPYSASKAASDHLARAWWKTYGLPVTISQCSNNYGPAQAGGKFIPVVIQRALAGEPVPIYGDGHQVRDWLHVEDHCRAIETLLEQGEAGGNWCVGANNEHQNLEVARGICAVLDRLRPDGAPHERHLSHVEDRPGHDRRYALDSTRLHALGWRPRRAWQQGLEETVTWYLERFDARRG
jgi:dTDP-glucose 4,6-dehydratase